MCVGGGGGPYKLQVERYWGSELSTYLEKRHTDKWMMEGVEILAGSCMHTYICVYTHTHNHTHTHTSTLAGPVEKQ